MPGWRGDAVTAPLLAGVELGGTKSIAVLARGSEILEQAVWPTLSPEETLGRISGQLRQWHRAHGFSAVGIASFGPVRLDRSAPDYGCILQTPKPGWSGAPVAARLMAGLDCPWQIDTDVNAAALAEYLWGAGQGCRSLCYITIGTGVGGGLVIDGQPVHGALHPEIGHLRLKRALGDEFPGACRFHGDCVEGLISGPALEKRLRRDPALVTDGDTCWDEVASDLAELAAAILLTVSAERILVGGGVAIERPFLLERARVLLVENLGGYLPFIDKESVHDVLRQPALGRRAGPLGAVALAATLAA
ncbi:MAG: ROK family protein [Candidatus Andeanibacterium colombiense]|uniref:fructokinase n=1 Tax=Candidatus Andeanibacterium colombiense TaxID=3121345 RepID=A0AAJ6BMC7_9SPHN|nr:MAG: ROK family protein [Sphingomonadaceae bacterium]